ncbi:MAG TPA: transcription antitermination factor NusB [Streptosporangiaceae bacterium]|nr:transcription antitermination factor NusB [Streptosporangiaceae bacterium]
MGAPSATGGRTGPADRPGGRRRTPSRRPVAARRGAGPPADPARRVAYDVLSAVTGRGAYANLLLTAMLSERGLRGQDAALATELVYGTLRARGSYDAVIALAADRDLERIDPPVREVLRLGAHQLLGMRVKPHAAVATSVDLAVAVAGRRPSGFVNAVLRRVAMQDLESWIAIAAPDRAADLIGHLSVRYSHPRWIVAALADALGDDPAAGLAETEAALAADLEPPAVTLCAVPGLASTDELIAAGAEPARWSPFGGYLASGDPGMITAVSERRAAVQDEASQLAALALSRVPASGGDGRWLDMCAGPGGKARLLAGLAAGQRAFLVAADVREHRARLAGRSISGIGHAAAVAADGTAPAWREAAFDRVLADVPCSGLGSLRRRPEVRWRRTADDVSAMTDLQLRLLLGAIDSVRPGGTVAYVTCSPHVAETRQVIGDALQRRDDLEVLDAPGVLPEVADLRCPEPYGSYAQFWPHRHGTDAIFVALLRRNGGADRQTGRAG